MMFMTQMHGFTCGVDDLLLLESKDRERKRLLEKCEELGEEIHRGFVGVNENEKIGVTHQHFIFMHEVLG